MKHIYTFVFLRKFFVFGLFFSLFTASYGQLIVSSGGAATAIAQNIVGPGVTISNAVINCNVAAYGTFTGSGTNLGIPAGILLSTGSATNAVGPNNTGASTTAWGTTYNDGSLIALQPGANRDVCILEFDILPQCSTLTIQYVFGSEEYPEWVSSTFNDAFGFFLSGPNPAGGNYTNVNIATVPATGQYVSIDNVNATTNNAYYVNNAGGATIQYDGFTVPMVASANVVACQIYHMKIIIADAGDNSYDSGVFFNSGGLTCPLIQILGVNVSSTPSSCTANTGTASVSIQGGLGPFSYSWSNGQTGVTNISGLAPGNYTVTVNDLNACTAPITQPFTITSPSPVTATIAQTNVTCNGGNTGDFTISPTSGVAPFQYSVNGGSYTNNTSYSGLTAGTYNVGILAGNGCTTTIAVTITEPPALVAQGLVLTNVTCNGGNNGSASVTPSGGAGTYTYSWSNGQTTQSISNLTAGTYTITLADALAPACSTSTSVTITEPSPLSAAPVVVANVSCNGGFNGIASVTPGGGSGNYNYSWLTTPVQTTQQATNLSANTYTVFVKDANDLNCQIATTVTISEPPALVITLDTIVDVTCNGGSNGSVQITASGGSGAYNYSWTSLPTQSIATASNLPAGTYTIFLSDALDAACVAAQSYTVAEPTPLSAVTTLLNDADCFGAANGAGFVTANGGSSGYLYSWLVSPAQLNDSASNLQAGTYTVLIADNMDIGCLTSATLIIGEPTPLGLNLVAMNPATCFGASDGDAVVIGSGGSGNYAYSWLTTPTQLNDSASNLSAGNYTVFVSDANAGACSTSLLVNVTEPTQLVANTNLIANVDCFGASNGAAFVVANGSSGNYSYSWATTIAQLHDTATALAAGTYTVFVNDTSSNVLCQTSATININEPSPLQATANIVANVSCFGGTNGSVNVVASGSNNNYTYSWDTNPPQLTATATNLPIGTYTVYVTDATATVNCMTSDTITVTEPPILSITLDTIIDVTCYLGTNGSIQVTANGGSGAYLYTWNTFPTQSTPTVNNLFASVYSLTLRDANDANCFTVANYAVNQPTQLNISSTLIADVSCFGGNDGSGFVTTIGGSGNYFYSWLTSPVQPNDTVFNLAAGTYAVYIIDAIDANCFLDTNLVISQPNPLNVVVNANTPVSCFGGSDGSLSVTASGGSGNYSYSWDTNPSQSTSAISGLSAGNYTVYVSDTNSPNCTTSLTITVNQAAQLTAITNVINQADCFGAANGSASVTAGGGSGNYTYSWVTSPSQATSTATGLAAGTYTVYVSDATTTNCQTSDTVTITQPQVLAAQVNLASPITCNGGSNGALQATATGGSGNYAYSWTTIPPQLNDTATGLSAIGYTVYVSDPNAANCVTTQAFTLSQPSPLSALATMTQSVSCNGGTNGMATVAANGGGIGGYTYSWLTTPVKFTQNVSNLSAGTYTVWVIDGNDTNCKVSTTVTITEPTAVVVNTTSITNVSCNKGNDGAASVNAQGGWGTYTYTWLTNPQQFGPSATNLQAGTYNIIVKDSLCTKVHQVQVTEPNPFTISIQTTNVTCNGTATGSATAIANGGTPNYQYSWNTNPAQLTATASGLIAGTYTCFITDNNNCSIQKTITITEPNVLVGTPSQTNIKCFGDNTGKAIIQMSGGTSPYTFAWIGTGASTATASSLLAGNYTVIVTDKNGCIFNQNYTITQPQSPLSVLSNHTNATCYGSNDGTLSGIAGGGTGPYTYTWHTNPTQLTANATNIGAGTYTLTVRDANNCTTSLTETVTQPPKIQLTLQPKNAYCNLANGSVLASASGGYGQYTYSWHTNPAVLSPQITNIYEGNYTVTVVDSMNCTAEKTVIINNTPPPIAAFSTEPNNSSPIFISAATIYFDNQSTGNTGNYIWQFGDGFQSNTTNPNHTYTEPNIYAVMLIAFDPYNSCPDTAIQNIEIIPNGEIYAPNVFSPNQDGANDEFFFGGQGIKELKCLIFDRWGVLLKVLESPSDTWDGKNKEGKELPEGTYTYKLDVTFNDGRALHRGGTIMLLR